MSASKLDAVYRSILITKFFTKGWGKPDNLRRIFEFRKVISNREECYKLIPADYPVTITKEEKHKDFHILEGHFLTPLETFLPGVVPKCAQQAHFQVIMPTNWIQSDYKPMCVHLAGTGDHYFWRRRNLMAKPLIKDAGIGAIILENPFYGLRKPQDQVRSSLHNVSDIFVMGGCLILETMVLLHWCERMGLGPLGVTGLSMGGHMASLAATNWPKPLVLVPCLSWSTASAVFTQGVMAHSINWELLETQFFSDGEYRNKLAKMVTIIDEAFLAGRNFAQRYSGSPSNSNFIDFHTINLPTILSNSSEHNNKFDITNPNNVSTCQGFEPEKNQNYCIINNNKKADVTLTNTTSLGDLKNNFNISETLFNKITSKQKFELNHNEITELNELAFKSVNLNKAKFLNDNNNTVKIMKDEVKPNNTVKSLVLCDNNKQSNINSVCKSKSESNLLQNILSEDNNNEKNSSSSLAKNLLASIPFLVTKSKEEDSTLQLRKREALQFMRGVMDECTHLGNFSVPFDTSLIIAVCAKHDAYVPRGNSGALEDLWPGAEVRYIDAGHVSAYVLHQSHFRSCIIEAFEKSKQKWDDSKKLI